MNINKIHTYFSVGEKQKGIGARGLAGKPRKLDSNMLDTGSETIPKGQDLGPTEGQGLAQP